MLDLEQAIARLTVMFQGATLGLHIQYRGLFIFQVFLPLEDEEGYDPFYSVNRETGEVLDYNIMEDGDLQTITELFMTAKAQEEYT